MSSDVFLDSKDDRKLVREVGLLKDKTGKGLLWWRHEAGGWVRGLLGRDRWCVERLNSGGASGVQHCLKLYTASRQWEFVHAPLSLPPCKPAVSSHGVCQSILSQRRQPELHKLTKEMTSQTLRIYRVISATIYMHLCQLSNNLDRRLVAGCSIRHKLCPLHVSRWDLGQTKNSKCTSNHAFFQRSLWFQVVLITLIHAQFVTEERLPPIATRYPLTSQYRKIFRSSSLVSM